MEISTVERIAELKEAGVTPVYSIWICEEVQDDGTFDVNVWDEIENERAEELEETHFSTYDEAKNALIQIVMKNPNITFVRLSDQRK